MTSFGSDSSRSGPDADAVPSTADLRATVVLLKDLVARAEATLTSVSAFLNPHAHSSSSYGAASLGRLPFPDPAFCRCPYDPRHRMPPESLFRHSLRCPSSPGAPLLDLGFLETVRYASSFKSEAELRRENPFVRRLPDSGADLCFSVEKEMEDVGGSGFFYRDCPAVVTYPEPDISARTFTLPVVLSAECANFICSKSDREIGFLGRENVPILPSEFWAFRREVEGWKDYPDRYSYTAARVASCLRETGDCGLRKWIISNSPRFGILIDAAMRDHIVILLKLCLKAAWREASGSLELLSGDGGTLDPRSLCLRCPCLFQALTWLASQLLILYGGTNGKNFAINMVSESLLRVGSSLLLFPLDECSSRSETHQIRQEISGNKLDADVTDGSAKSAASEDIRSAVHPGKFCTGQIFVSQVAAAVAALHERSLLEDTVKQLRFPQLHSKYQLIYEHSNVSMRANEVRAKRPNYKPIPENDGLLWQKPQNQGMSRAKTREELLAEERDYKRRRMSYRGKKAKRTMTEVIRDIIEEHMEEIKQAGGIGCNTKGPADAEMLISGSTFEGDVSANAVSGLSVSDGFGNKRLPEFDVTAGMLEGACRKDSSSTDRYLSKVMREQRHVDHKIHQHSERTVGMGEHMNDDYGHSANYRSHRKSNDRHTHWREVGSKEGSQSKYDKRNSSSSRSFKDYTDSSSLYLSSMSKEEYSHGSERRNKNKGRNHDSHRSESVTKITFEDRYEPCATYEDCSTDASSTKKYNPNYHDLQRHHHPDESHEHEKT